MLIALRGLDESLLPLWVQVQEELAALSDDSEHITAPDVGHGSLRLPRPGSFPGSGTDKRGRKRYVTTRKEGPHQLRHYYASVMLADGVSVKELAEFLGHHNAAFTLRILHALAAQFPRAGPAGDRREDVPAAGRFSRSSDGVGL